MKKVTTFIARQLMAAVINRLAILLIASLMFIGFTVGAYQRPAKAFNETSSMVKPKASPQNGAAKRRPKADTSSQTTGVKDRRHYTIASKDRPPADLPRYNQVFRKATHNSYWVDGARDRQDAFAAGPRQRVLDQAFHEHVRGFEFDIHFKGGFLGLGGNPGEFDIYHTDSQDNSTTYSLEDCLQLMQRIDYVLPDHEVINIIIEFKEVAGNLFGDDFLFAKDHHPEDLDRVLWEHLGARLYTPREFLERCASGTTLRDCVRSAGWPTTDELRGRYIVNVIGNDCTNPLCFGTFRNDQAYRTYLDGPGGIINRAAFPLRSVLSSNADDSSPCTDKCAERRASEIFWQVEDNNMPDVPKFIRDGGIVRSKAAHMINDPVPPGNSDDIGSMSQRDAMNRGYQLLMTDYPWNFVNDAPYNALNPLLLPARVNRPFFEIADTVLGAPRRWPEEELTEPGSRIYFNTANRFIEADLISPTAGTLESDPNKQGYAEAFVDRTPAGAFDNWEVFPSTTMVTHGAGPRNSGAPGVGCFFARSLEEQNEVTICREAETNGGRDVAVRVTVKENGKVTYDDKSHVHKNVTEPFEGYPPLMGDAFQILLAQQQNEGRTRVTLWTANAVFPDGTMEWVKHHAHTTRGNGGDFYVAGLLSRQGISQTNEGVFTGTRLNGEYMPLSRFQTRGSYVVDQSFCADGSCRQTPRPTHESIYMSPQDARFVGVHEAQGTVFDQRRTLYTADEFEVTTSGLYENQTFDKFLLLKDDPAPGAPMTALFKCVDWRRNYHQYWLSTDSTCPNPNTKEAYARSGGRIGYIATTALSGTQPLWHLRKGTHNAGSADTHDHYFAVGDVQRDVKINNEGYSLVGNAPVGWVYTIVLACPEDIVVDADPGQCGAIVRPPFLNGSIVSYPANSFFPVGTTTLTASLAHGQHCPFKVIVRDQERPVIRCNPDANFITEDGKTFSSQFPVAPGATDNCSSVTVTGQRGDGKAIKELYPAGITTITWTARDDAGNTASCQQTINVKTRADLQVYQLIPPNSPLKAGKLVNYQIQVTNLGPSPALGVSLSNSLSSKVELVNITTNNGACSKSQNLTCNLGTINPGASTVVRLTVRLRQAGQWRETVLVSANPVLTFDPNPGNNTLIIFRDITP